jgi:hypothetical protein
MWREGRDGEGVEVTHVVIGPIHGVGGLATVGRVERRLARTRRTRLKARETEVGTYPRPTTTTVFPRRS